MADIIVSIDREIEPEIVEHLRRAGAELGWRYAASLAGRLGQLRSGAVLREFPVGFHRVDVDDDAEDAELVRLPLFYDRSGRVTAESNCPFAYSALGLPFQKGGRHQSYLATMNVSQAWAAGVNGAGVRVAVVDSGQDGLQCGPVNDYYDVANANTILHPSPPVPVDRDGHGTAMSCLIREVAPGAEIHIVRISDQSRPLLWNLLAGVAVAAYDCNAEIINLSVGYNKIQGCACGAIGAARSLALRKMLEAITQSGFRIYVAATGNEFSSIRFNDPAEFGNAVAVGSVNASNYRSRYSNYGTANHPCYVLAPGGEEDPPKTILEHVGTCGHTAQNPCLGTSVAAAYASGMLALLRSDNRHKRDTRAQFLAALPGYCKMPAHAQGNTAEYGNGVLQYMPEAKDAGAADERRDDYSMVLDHDVIIRKKDHIVIGGIRVPRRET
jgi:subtilisin family serine protease